MRRYAPRRKGRNASKMSIELLKRLKAIGVELPGADDDYYIQKTNAGHWQRSAGAWAWSLEIIDPEKHHHRTSQLGSQYTLTELLKGYFDAGLDMHGFIVLYPDVEKDKWSSR